MSVLTQQPMVDVVITIPAATQQDAWAVANWVREALIEDGLPLRHGRPFGRTRRNQNLGYSMLWSDPVEMSFSLLDVSAEVAEEAIRRAVADAPGRVGSVQVNYNESGA